MADISNKVRKIDQNLGSGHGGVNRPGVSFCDFWARRANRPFLGTRGLTKRDGVGPRSAFMRFHEGAVPQSLERPRFRTEFDSSFNG